MTDEKKDGAGPNAGLACPEYDGGPHVPDDDHDAHCNGCGAWLGDGVRALCTKAPPGWSCSRTAGHEGPCAARAVTVEGERSEEPASAGHGVASRSPSARSTSEPVPRAEDGQRVESAGLSSWPDSMPVTKAETIERLCKLLNAVWEHFDPNAYEANDCFCGTKRWLSDERWRSSGQALAYIENVVRGSLSSGKGRAT